MGADRAGERGDADVSVGYCAESPLTPTLSPVGRATVYGVKL
jgi:hypothetical protein